MGLCQSDGARKGSNSNKTRKQDINTLADEYKARVEALETKLSELTTVFEQDRKNTAILALEKRLDDMASAEKKIQTCYNEVVAALQKVQAKLEGQDRKFHESNVESKSATVKLLKDTEDSHGQLTRDVREMKAEMSACVQDLRTAMQRLRSHTSAIVRIDEDINKLKGKIDSTANPVCDKGILNLGAGCIAGVSGIPDYHNSNLMIGAAKEFPRITSDDPNVDRLSLRPLTPGPASDNDLD
uniref:Uncharacterized protein n=1 Tax=Lotharella oceanica TaxID=641309 RepID=A0A7S2TZV6_9EUKA|mmetsp:Transcript_35597/g.65958  ORF Transcript_35597/g.65958 Transcript_35597/m.65958 type:complete len:242 (+) Transcript_35597:86-811(+)